MSSLSCIQFKLLIVQRVADNETRDFSQGRDPSSREYYMLKHPQFSTEEQRLSSFEASIKFPRFQYLNPEGLSKAGFFYQGKNH